MRERELFIEAMERCDVVARAAFLREACGDDEALRLRVEQLLEAHAQRESFILDAPPPGIETGSIDVTAHAAGETIGPYRLLEPIGEGGFGTVYAAEQQQPLRRRVALKVLKPGMDSREVVGRFQVERQALALMDHPHIAKVFDAGTTELGRPYFVMELIHGLPITEYCDQCSLPMSGRLELFLLVCHAVQHAHQKGIIHRDLKPSNVLVAFQDGQPTPKVIDFGVAKAINQRLTDDSLRTGFTQLIGTPLYMSPEQAEMSPLEIDTRGDIYSLGVLLYELLTGVTPFEPQRLKVASFDELRRIIREEEPPTPSARVSTLGDAADGIAQCRRTNPRQLIQAMRGDLDWIAMKCLEKDRTRRYPTTEALARDIQCYLRCEPVEASPPSLLYRLRKLLRRRRGPVLAASLILLALIGGAVGTTIGMVRARSARDEAAVAGGQTLAALRTLVDDVIERQLARETHVTDEDREFLARVLEHFEQFAKTQGDSRESRAMRAEGFHRMGIIREALGELASARTAYERAGQEYERLAVDDPTPSSGRQSLAATHNCLGCLLKKTGDFAAAERELMLSQEMNEQLLRDFPDEPSHRLNLAMNLNNLSNLRAQLGQNAEPEARAAVELLETLVEEFPDHRESRAELARSINSLGVRLQGQHRYAECRVEFERAIELQEKLASEQPGLPTRRQQLALFHNNLGNCFLNENLFAKAIDSYQHSLTIYRQLSADFPAAPHYRHEQARCHGNLAVALGQSQQMEAARAANRTALAMREQLAQDFPSVVDYQDELAVVLINRSSMMRKSGDIEESLGLSTRAIDTVRPLVERNARLTRSRYLLMTGYEQRALTLMASERFKDALADWDRAIARGLRSYLLELRLRRARCLARIAPDDAVAAAEEIVSREGASAYLVYEAACTHLFAAERSESPEQREQYAKRAASLYDRALAQERDASDPLVDRVQGDAELAALQRQPTFERFFQSLRNLTIPDAPSASPGDDSELP